MYGRLSSAPAVFAIPSDGKPEIVYDGATTSDQANAYVSSWFILQGQTPDPDPVADLGGAGNQTVALADLTSIGRLTINATGGTLTFGGTGPIVITAPTVIINANNVDLEGRALTDHR